MAMRAKLLFLFLASIHAQNDSSEADHCSKANGGLSHDDVMLLQHSTKAESVSLPGFALDFKMVEGTLRVLLPVQLGGKGLSLLLDTGSGTLAICKGIELPNSIPKPLFKGGTQMVYDSYGGNSHGWVGTWFTDELQLTSSTSNLNASVNFAKMFIALGEEGNACGGPMDGIIGFGVGTSSLPCLSSATQTQMLELRKYNGIWSSLVPHLEKDAPCTGAGWTLSDAQTIPAMHQMMTAANVKHFGIYWSGQYGAETGRLLFNDAFDGVKFLPLIGSAQTAAMDCGEGDNQGKYCVSIMSWSFTPLSSKEPLFSVRYTSSTGKVTGNGYIDSGATTIAVPQELCDQIGSFAKTSGQASGLLSIQLAGPEGVDGEAHNLNFRVTKNTFSELFSCTTMSSGNVGRIGLPVWSYYRYIAFDFGHREMSFYPSVVQ